MIEKALIAGIMCVVLVCAFDAIGGSFSAVFCQIQHVWDPIVTCKGVKL